MYQLLYDFIGFDATTCDCPELIYVWLGGMSCVMVVVVLYMILYFILSVFRGTK